MKEDTTDGTVACGLNPDAFARGRAAALIRAEDALARRELPDGFELSFPGDEHTARDLMDFVLAERRCCTFLGFGLTFEPHLGSIHLTLGGSQQAKDFLAARGPQ